MKLKTSAQGKNIDSALDSIKSDMQPYTEIITNKDTIDKATHVFAPSKPKDLKSYRMVFSTMNVERMNSILFEDSTIVRSSQSGATTYNNNTGVANYDDNSEMYHYKTYLKMRKAQAIWKKPFQEHLNLSTAMVDSLTKIIVYSVQIIRQVN